MRVRVVRLPDPTSSEVKLVVQRWCAGQWEFVQPFALSESEQANEFAMKLSMTKREPAEMATFVDGEKVTLPSLEDRAKLLREIADNAALASYPTGLAPKESEQP